MLDNLMKILRTQNFTFGNEKRGNSDDWYEISQFTIKSTLTDKDKTS